MGLFDSVAQIATAAAAPIQAAYNTAGNIITGGRAPNTVATAAQILNPVTGAQSAYNMIQRPASAVSGVGSDVRSNLGSAGYLNPMTAPFMMAEDESNMQSNIKRARDEEDAAMARAGQTRQQVMNIRDAQRRMLDQYKEQQPGIKRGLLESSQRGISGELNRANTATKAAAAGRGILRSGIQKQAEAQAKSDAASKYAKSSYDIGNQLENQLADFEDQYIQTGLDVDSAGLENQIAMQRRALEEMERRGKALGQLGQGVGQLGGTYLANREKK